MAGVQHSSRARRARGDSAEQLGVSERHGPQADRFGQTHRLGPRDGVWRLSTILARFQRRAQHGVRPVCQLPGPPGGWQLADGPFLRFLGLDSAAAYRALRGWAQRPGSPWADLTAFARNLRMAICGDRRLASGVDFYKKEGRMWAGFVELIRVAIFATAHVCGGSLGVGI